ncbi:hypothetical protein [Paenibacillus sedimenti]|uniref:DUF4436 domain-containing protein n=1 Tax=Paenibacillus sedimenti TaxID=2770274 RepID=A0A926QJC5_9BACL|nr:hypothetical protein [Paenibacillus sedimenti]MBD0381415.1 hypothetical protein [Paenibacillus sedimenti]
MSLFRMPFMVIAAVLSMLLPSAVSANGGPLYDPADAYGLLRLDENSNISLIREKVTYTIQNDFSDDRDAEVSVRYELKSKNDYIKTVAVLFLTPVKEQLSVTDGTRNIATSPVSRDLPNNWYGQQKDTVTDPVSGHELPLASRGKGEIQAEGTQFSLTFEPGESKEILIQYKERGGMYDKGVVNTIFSHLYFLTPAEFWEGEPQVELEVFLSKPGSRLHSSLPINRMNDHAYRATFSQLPDEEWYFSYTYPKRLLYPTNVEKDHNLLILATTLMLTAFVASITLHFRNIWIFILGAIGIMTFTFYFISKMGGYPFNDIFVGLTDIAVGSLLVWCFIKLRKRME